MTSDEHDEGEKIRDALGLTKRQVAHLPTMIEEDLARRSVKKWVNENSRAGLVIVMGITAVLAFWDKVEAFIMKMLK